MEDEIFVRETEPTMLPVPDGTGEKLGRCPVCGEAIYAGEQVILAERSRKMVHTDCAESCRHSLTLLLDLIGIDYYVGDAEEMAEDV